MAKRISALIVITVLAVLCAAPLPAPTTAASTDRLRVKGYVLDFDPLLDGGRPLTVDRGWNDPVALDDQYRADVSTASAGIVTQRIARFTTVRDYPVKVDGFRFTNTTYLGCLTDSSADPCDDLIDYGQVLNTVYDPHLGSACDALRRGRADEIWLWGGPWFGYEEWTFVAADTLCTGVRRPFVVMGFNYERGEPEMLHDLGHRAEGLVAPGIGYALWDRFDGQRPRYGQDSACPAAPDAGHPEVDPTVTHAGNVHFPPNAYCHYQYDRDLAVLSDADDWANFPNLTGHQTWITASTWGASQRGFLIWWLGRMPHHIGSVDGVDLDWWRYIFLSPRS